MSLQLHASARVRALLRLLLSQWTDWNTRRDYYLFELLPKLQSDSQSASRREDGKILLVLKSAATKHEWAYLPIILANLDKTHPLTVSGILQLLAYGKWQEADAKHSEIESDCPKDTYGRAKQFCYARWIDSTRERIKGLLANEYFDRAERLWASNAEVFTPQEYEEICQYQRRLIIERQLAELESLLETYRFTKADAFYAQPACLLSSHSYLELRNRYYKQWQDEQALEARRKLEAERQRLEQEDLKRRRAEEENRRCREEKQRLLEQERQRQEAARLRQIEEEQRQREHERQWVNLCSRLESFEFAAADRAFVASPLVNKAVYAGRRMCELQRYFLERYNRDILLNQEQAAAITAAGSATLITARAGSGKTRVIVCKAAMLIDQEHLDPCQVLILAFNRSAAQEVQKRMQGEFGLSKFSTAMTFHRLANQLVQPMEDLLAEDFGPKSSRHVLEQALIDIWDHDFALGAYEFLRSEVTPEELPDTLDVQFLNERRELNQITLNGETVKSRGEKYIADFLFEHDIRYEYERSYRWEGRPYRPDFTLFRDQGNLIIEHWGIDPSNVYARVPKEWTKSTEQYRSEIAKKREFWQDNSSAMLIETSIADLAAGREHFEEQLRTILEAHGVTCERLPQEELLRRVANSTKRDRLSNLFLQFIKRAKKRRISAERLVNTYGHRTDDTVREYREAVFWSLASRAYVAYEQKRHALGCLDFEDLMWQAVDLIKTSQGECTFDAGKRPVRLNDVRWLLIDEFQDLSPAFFELMKAMRISNPNLRVFCVGDDWQAINGFAGSDLRYFHNFAKNLRDASIMTLTTNHRSRASIVHTGNKFMEGKGTQATPRAGTAGGYIAGCHIDGIPYEWGDKDSPDEEYPDRKYRVKQKGYDRDFRVARCLKFCHQLILERIPDQIEVLILSRTNEIHGVSIEEFRAKLAKLVPQESKVRVSTVHTAKGDEADVVILLDICSGRFPLVKADSLLFRIFHNGDDNVLESALKEEERLFYVALSRAKDSLWILTIKGQESPFLSRLDIEVSGDFPYRAPGYAAACATGCASRS